MYPWKAEHTWKLAPKYLLLSTTQSENNTQQSALKIMKQ